MEDMGTSDSSRPRRMVISHLVITSKGCHSRIDRQSCTCLSDLGTGRSLQPSDHIDCILLVGNLGAFCIALLARSSAFRSVIGGGMDANVGCSGREEARKAFHHRISVQQSNSYWRQSRCLHRR